ncbi:MAG: radical SAM protein [Chloroflexi bacterium]|nr:radical SAM protein [Chloroflexota bacterium]
MLTPASGFIKAYKFSLNPYGGCGFGCEYCYARFFAPTPEASDSWGEWVRVKENAAALVVEATREPSERLRLCPGDPVYMSSVTDPYQPIESRLGLTRGILEALIPVQPRLVIQTRSPVATRDIDLFQQFDRIRVNLSVPTDSEAVRLRYEPHAPSIRARLKAAETLTRAGVPVGISISPMLGMDDASAFGRRIAGLDAAEYVVTGFHRPGPRFAAGTPVSALEKARADGWNRARYDEAVALIQEALGTHPLLKGNEGYAPPK